MPTDPDFQRNRVLLVEDEFLIAADLEEELERHGFHVIAVAMTVEEANRLVSSLDFQVAVLDVNLNGHMAFEAIRPVADRQIPFVLVSGERSLELPDWAQAAPLVRKPADSCMVAQMLRAMVG